MSIITFAGLLSGVGSGKLARDTMEGIQKELAEEFGLTAAEVLSVAEKVAKDIDFKNISTKTFSEIKTKLRKGVEDLKIAKLNTIATQIANGHAYDKHIHEFADLGIKTKEEFSLHIKNIINKPTKSKNLDTDRKAYIDENSETVIVYDPNHIDFGTALIPNESWGSAINYYNQLK